MTRPDMEEVCRHLAMTELALLEEVKRKQEERARRKMAGLDQ